MRLSRDPSQLSLGPTWIIDRECQCRERVKSRMLARAIGVLRPILTQAGVSHCLPVQVQYCRRCKSSTVLTLGDLHLVEKEVA